MQTVYRALSHPFLERAVQVASSTALFQDAASPLVAVILTKTVPTARPTPVKTDVIVDLSVREAFNVALGLLAFVKEHPLRDDLNSSDVRGSLDAVNIILDNYTKTLDRESDT